MKLNPHFNAVFLSYSKSPNTQKRSIISEQLHLIIHKYNLVPIPNCGIPFY